MIRRSFAQVLLATAFLAASCGGSDTPAPASGVEAGTGSVPLYRPATEMLTLPQLRVAGTIATDVKLQLKKDGSWAMLSAGPVRVATASDAPGAMLAEPGSNTDLDGARTDATLAITRLHVNERVFTNVTIRLKGTSWAFAGELQQVKTLHLEDFKSNPAIWADESHHVVLKSSPNAGVQNVPMRLSSRNYKFCMEAQAEGADSTTLLDAASNTVFTLKAGDPCIAIKVDEGAYTLQHRYGGKGSARTLFMRHQANTTSAVGLAAQAPVPDRSAALKLSTPSAIAPITKSAFSGSKPEYWAMTSTYQTPGYYHNPEFRAWLSFGQYVDGLDYQPHLTQTADQGATSVSAGTSPSLCSGTFWSEDGYAGQGPGGGWVNNVFFRVTQNFGTPSALGDVLVCKNARPMGYKSSAAGLAQYYFPTVWIYPLGQLPAGDTDLTLGIVDFSGTTFGLQTQGTNLPIVASQAAYQGLAAGQSGLPPDRWKLGYRYFPEGLPEQFSLGVGQVALYTQPGCTGPAVISEGNSIRFFSYNFIPELAGLGASFKMGLQTAVTAYSGQEYAGEAQHFDQLTCNSGGFGSTGWSPGSIEVTVDTVTMVISTDSCEYCNLAGVDFTGLNLTNAKLSYANLNGANLSNADLSGADLRNATLQGAQLISTNLDSANLCAAQLNGSAAVSQAATLTGAHLRNTNLANANLDGVKFSSASFYSSSSQGVCQPTSCASYVAPICASAYNASMNNTSFDSAYLSNIDMGNVKGVGVNFSNASLFGVSLAGADLSHNNLSAVSSSFNNAYLQGTDFSRAILKFADFTGARFDPGSSCIQANLAPSYGQFPGSKVPIAPGSTSCVPGKPTAAFCVQTQFAASPTYPATDCTNICADGTRGGQVGPQNGSCSSSSTCSVASWAAPRGDGNSSLPTSSCQASAPLCGNPFTGDITNRCW